MSANRVAALVVGVVWFAGSCWGQINQFSATFGRTFVSTQTIQGVNFFNHDVHFGNEETIGLNYSRQLKTFKGMALSAELPIAAVIDVDLNTGANLIPEYYRAFFVAPSARLNFFHAEAVSPWVSAGGGYAHFKQAGHLLYFGPNPGPTSTNTGVIQIGTGLDVFPWNRVGFRLEARDFYSGVPDLNVDTGRSRQHNYYVGGGVIIRW